jgi:transcriptional regulator with XRE-family HTH domain
MLTLGSLIKSRRNGFRDLTQIALSTKAGLPPNAVGDLERGNRSIEGEELVRICIALEIPVDSFLGDFKEALAKTLRPIEQRIQQQRGNRMPEPRPAAPVEPDELDGLTIPDDPTVLVLAVKVARSGNQDVATVIQTMVRALDRHRWSEGPGGTPPGKKR